LLAHEIAHLARRDPQWRLAARVIERVLWFQPLNRVARVRLEAQAEFMCDALAVDADADPRELAGCLAACALRGIDLTPFAAAIASHPSLLRRRIRQLTEGSLMPSTSNPLLRGAIAIACAGLLYAIPTIELQAQAAAGPRSASSSMSSSSSHAGKQRNVSISTSDEDGEISMKYKSRDDSGTLEVTAEGKVEYTEQEDGIASLGSDGEFEIEDDRDGTERRIVYKPSGNGVQARYYVDGDELPLDAAGHAWLARVIPQILREAAFDVEARVDRLVKRGGTAAVFAEIELIQGSYARRAYLVALNARGPLTSADIDRSLALSFTLDSDFELRTAMSSTIESQNLNSAQRDRIVARMADMDSDFEARQVLMSLTPKLDDSSAPMLLAALKAIESDFERRQVLESLFARKDLTPRLIDIGLDGLEGMESDFEKRNVLTSAASHIGSDQAAMLKFIAATRTIESDFERRQVLTDLLGVGKPDSTVVAAILEAVADMDSDFESRQVLTELAPLVGTDADLRTRFRAITKDMSDFERQQAEDALVKM
jgi:hypothetical protein